MDVDASAIRELVHALEGAVTEPQFAEALADFRAPRRGTQNRRTLRKGMPSTWKLERIPGGLLPSRSEISEWENGKAHFDERQVAAYLHACRITGDLLDVCLNHYRRIMLKGPIDWPSQEDITVGRKRPISRFDLEAMASNIDSMVSSQPIEVRGIYEILLRASRFDGTTANARPPDYLTEIGRQLYPDGSPVDHQTKAYSLWRDGLDSFPNEARIALVIVTGDLMSDGLMYERSFRRELAVSGFDGAKVYLSVTTPIFRILYGSNDADSVGIPDNFELPLLLNLAIKMYRMYVSGEKITHEVFPAYDETRELKECMKHVLRRQFPPL